MKKGYDMSRILIKNAIVATMDETRPLIFDHDVWIEGKTIARIARAGSHPPQPQNWQEIDAGGRVLMPGFINAHMHFYSTFARGFARVMPSANFLEVLRHLWWRLDMALTPEDNYYSALLACIAAIKSGTTTMIDHHASPGAITGSLAALKRAVTDAGLRAALCYEVTDRNGPKGAQEGIAENMSFIHALAADPDERFAALFGLHASFTLAPETLEAAARAVAGKKVGFHLHVAEDAADQRDSLEKYGKRVVRRLYEHGILGSSTICAHCVHIDQDERELLQKTDTMVVHNPQSNMNNAVGAMDLTALVNQGVLVGLGTDAMTTNMREELRSGLWLFKHNRKDPSAGFTEVPRLLFAGNAQIAKRLWPTLGLGRIVEGARSDLALMDYIPATPMNADNVMGHVIFGISQASVHTTIASGRVLMLDGRLTTLNEADIALAARALAERLWQRIP